MAEICNSCGNNLYLADEAPRLVDEVTRLRNELVRSNSEIGRLRGEIRYHEINRQVDDSWRNRKMRKQSEEIRRLRKKLDVAEIDE